MLSNLNSFFMVLNRLLVRPATCIGQQIGSDYLKLAEIGKRRPGHSCTAWHQVVQSDLKMHPYEWLLVH